MPRKKPIGITNVRSMARQHTETAIRVLAGVMNQKDAQPAARIAAAAELLNRGWGKAPVTYDDDTTRPSSIQVTIQYSTPKPMLDITPKVVDG